MKTFMASPATIDRKWYVVDAEGMTLGRLASEVAKVLRGKNKAIYTPHIDTGDYVIVVNAEKIKVTGKKLDQKVYYNHSDYVGGMKETTLKEMLAKKPEYVIEHAVKGMLPKGPLGRQMAKKLHVYAGAEHEQIAQKPDGIRFYMQPDAVLDVAKIPAMIEAFEGKLRYISGNDAHFLYLQKALETGKSTAAVTGRTAAKEKRLQAERIFAAAESVVEAIAGVGGGERETKGTGFAAAEPADASNAKK